MDFVVIDVSFISLKLVIPSAIKILKPEGELIALVKPQFEVGKEEVENKGIIKDPQKHLNVLIELASFMKKQGWPLINLAASPITGQKGNREFLIHCLADESHPRIDEDYIRKIIKY
jgi:23S rRNA (cytidine1920-2'-O)/16S rRNA (cytidine1409-2'-O)-methyltransferase